MEKSVIKFWRSRDVQLPSRGHDGDAGMDFYVPAFDSRFISDLLGKNPHLSKSRCNDSSGTIHAHSTSVTFALVDHGSSNAALEFDLSDSNNTFIKFDQELCKNYFLLAPLSRVNIPSGIFCQMSAPGRALIASNKSGIASKHGLIFGAQVVDYPYQGEIHINVINTSPKVVRIYAGQKLIQFLETPVYISSIEEVPHIENLHPEATSRGKDGFGSTDKK
jgi:dUTPase